MRNLLNSKISVMSAKTNSISLATYVNAEMKLEIHPGRVLRQWRHHFTAEQYLYRSAPPTCHTR